MSLRRKRWAVNALSQGKTQAQLPKAASDLPPERKYSSPAGFCR
jgi:hypothetical protein